MNDNILAIYQDLRDAEPDSAGHIRDFGTAYLLAGNAEQEVGNTREMCRKFNLGRLQFVELEERFGIDENDREAFLVPLANAVEECLEDGFLEAD